MTTSASVQAKRSWASRLVHGRTAYILSASTEGLRVEDAKADYVVGTDQFAKPVRIVPGPVWASLEIETRTGKRQLRGFREREVRQVADALNATLNREARNRIFASQVRVSAAAASIEALLGSQRYVRQSDGAACMNQVGSLTDTVMHPSWDSWANESQRAQAWIVRRFIAHTAEDIARANELFMKSEFDRYSEFFDTIESSALTAAQRRACIAMERSNLVLAGAGTGKTSTMIGRAGYLIASSQAVPHQILMLAYGRKAAQEMQERQDKRLAGLCAGATPKIKTFHALGLEIIGAVEGKVPAITVMAEDSAVLDRFINDEMARQCLNPEYVSDVVRWCLGKQFSYSNPFDFDSEDEYEEYVESTELRTLQGELVKSHEELAIANFLYANRIQYLYESPYPIDLADQTHRRYTPDFYLSDYDIYLEHFALNRDMQAPAGWDGYLEGVIWKRQVHQTHGTRLLETRSHMQTEGALEQYLKESLTSVGVELDPLPAEVLLDELRSRGRLQYITKPFREFLTLLKDSAIELHSVRVMASDLPDAGRFELFFLLFEPILEAYESALADAGEVDFGDMIKRAVEYVETGRYQSPFTHILVDEFQDISASRSKLVKALLGQREDAVLFAVGDDWQSIYRFTGSDISLTRDFPAHFGATATTALDKTFRFNDRIGSVSSTFVQRNPSQLSKSIHSVASAGEPCVSLVPVRDRAYALDMCMTAIEQRAAAAGMERASVLVLARYGYVLDNWSSESRARMAARFPGLTVDFMTAHASKGREADFVVILGMEGGTNGFPAQKRPEPLHELLLPRPEEYPNAEERRLFYVTLTRARHRVYVLFEQDKPSDFVRELADRQSRYDVCTDEFANFAGGAAYLDEAPCPGCKRGHLVSRNGPTGEFVGCSRYPRCGYMESACRACGSPMRRADGKRVCTNAACDCVEPTCPECGAAMVRRKGKWGAFWGCANYKGDEAGSCRGKVKIEKR